MLNTTTSEVVTELDLTPTRETGRSKKSKPTNNTSQMSYRPERVKSSIPKLMNNQLKPYTNKATQKVEAAISKELSEL